MSAVNVLADIRKLVAEVTGKAEKEFVAEKAKIGADVRAAYAGAVEAAKVAAPGVVTADKLAVDGVVAAVEAALASHGI